MSECEAFSGPYFLVSGLSTDIKSKKSPYYGISRDNKDQNKLRIRTLEVVLAGKILINNQIFHPHVTFW